MLTIRIHSGHVFGLAHEHQCSDRDKCIHFACKNLKNYDDAKAKVDAKKNNKNIMKQVCDDEDLADKYGFIAAKKFARKEWHPGDAVKVDGPFDVASIMSVGSHSAKVLWKYTD